MQDRYPKKHMAAIQKALRRALWKAGNTLASVSAMLIRDVLQVLFQLMIG